MAREGSARAFEEITRRYQRRLRSYCTQFVGPAQAEDAVQQAFLSAYVALRGESRREIALRPWLYRIARNCAIDLLRSTPPDHEQLDLEYDGVPQPPRLVEQKEEMGRLVAALQRLPEGQRRALTLRELEGRSYEEISQTMGQTGPGVRQMIFRARTALRSGFAVLLPVGSLRSRILGSQPPVPDAYHVVAVTKVSSGGGLEAVGVLAAAALGLFTGMPAAPAPQPAASQPVSGLTQTAIGPRVQETGVAPSHLSISSGETGLRLFVAGRHVTASAPVAGAPRTYSVAGSAGRQQPPPAAPAQPGAGPGDPTADSGVAASGLPPAASEPSTPAGDETAQQSDGDGTGEQPAATGQAADASDDDAVGAQTSGPADPGAQCAASCDEAPIA